MATAAGCRRDTYSAPARLAPKALPLPVTGTPLGYSYVDQAHAAGLLTKTIYGQEHKNRYLLETTGGGVAFLIAGATVMVRHVADPDGTWSHRARNMSDSFLWPGHRLIAL